MRLRGWIQFLSTVIFNAWWMFPFTKTVYQGPLKAVCVPALNCYSCPAAIGACPIGALQFFMAGVRPAFAAGQFYLGLSVFGMMGLVGTLTGRLACGWICPFGFLQELIHKIPAPKIQIPDCLSHAKYIFLCFFVILFPLLIIDEFGYGSTWYCKYICPAGTLEAGIPMLILHPEFKELIGGLFYFKLVILILFLIAMIFISRPFCRIACPLGAVYSLFNKNSVLRMTHDLKKCARCRTCYQDCPMGVRFYEDANHRDCIRCLKCMKESCKYNAISCEMLNHDNS